MKRSRSVPNDVSKKPVSASAARSPQVQWVDIDEDRAGQRIDNFLLTFLKGVPRTLIYRILRKGEVRVNKGRVKAEYRLQTGDIIRVPPVRVPDAKAPAEAGKQLQALLSNAVLFENKGLLIINKPSGLAVHGGSGVNVGLIEALRSTYPEERYLELVHRLDKDTSGCIMVAKKRSMLRYLHEELRQRRIQKSYHALVEGSWPGHVQKVDVPLKRNEQDTGERMVRASQDGKPSLTLFRVLERFDDVTLVEAKPVTGRTHQIRVHAQFQGHPLVGDSKYTSDAFNAKMKAKGFNRLFLHAAALELTLPDSDGKIKIEAPLDSRLLEPLSRLSAQAQGNSKAFQSEE